MASPDSRTPPAQSASKGRRARAVRTRERLWQHSQADTAQTHHHAEILDRMTVQQMIDTATGGVLTMMPTVLGSVVQEAGLLKSGDLHILTARMTKLESELERVCAKVESLSQTLVQLEMRLECMHDSPMEDRVSIRFETGDYVLLQGLASRSDLNGQKGYIMGYVATRNRWQVGLDDAPDPILVKSVNLVLQQPVMKDEYWDAADMDEEVET